MPKPPPFTPGSKAISAKALNDIRDAVLSLLRGGNGVDVTMFGDKVTISLSQQQGALASPFALMTVVTETDQYLVCNRDGVENQTCLVAKPWGLRKGADWPTGPTYVYDEEVVGKRTATFEDESEEVQYITPGYQEGEELLAMRVPSARIPAEDLLDPVPPTEIVWVDMNLGGRCWNVGGIMGRHWHARLPATDGPIVCPADYDDIGDYDAITFVIDDAGEDEAPLGMYYDEFLNQWCSNTAKWG